MEQDPSSTSNVFEFEVTRFVHALLRLVFAVRYRKYLVIAVMAAGAFLGELYYTTRPRLYCSKASLLVSQNGRDRLDTSIANEEATRQNTMPTFKEIIVSAKVLEGALQKLGPAELVDFDNAPRDAWVGILHGKVVSQVVRNTSIIEVSYCSKNPKAAANMVNAVVQSYLDFMDRIHKGTAGELSRILTRERNEVAGKLAQKQEELLTARRNLADLGFRSEGKTLHPMVQRAVYFNDALIDAQKRRVEYEAALAALQAAMRNGEDLGQYMTMVSEVAGKELLLNSLGLGSQDVSTQSNLAQNMLDARAKLETMRQNFGPKHPEVTALEEKIRLTEEFLQVYQQRTSSQLAERCRNRLGPWLAQMLQQKLIEVIKKEEILQVKFEETRDEAVNLSGQLAQVELLERDIKRLSDMNDVLLNQIASLDLKQNGQDIRVAVIEEPKVSASPISPKLPYVVLFVLLGGFCASLTLVTLLDTLDDRFRSMEELQNRLGVPVLTVIQRLKTPETAGLRALAMFVAPSTPECEGFRTLRTALSLTHQDVHQVLLTSLEAGDGKTTAAANLAVCYAQANKHTLLIDADMRRSGLTNLLNVKGTNGLSEILRLEGNLEQLTAEHIRTTGVKGLDILPAGPRPGNPAELLAGPRFSQLLSWAGSVYDMILIDTTPALITADPAIISRVVDGVIMVIRPAKNRRRQVMRMVERYTLLKLPVLGLIVNAAGSETDNAYYNHYYYDNSYEYYAAEEDDDHQSEASVPEHRLFVGSKLSAAADQEKAFRPLNVPRRVA
jgi:succinoglycan biosynthesis transport protein ExoP